MIGIVAGEDPFFSFFLFSPDGTAGAAAMLGSGGCPFFFFFLFPSPPFPFVNRVVFRPGGARGGSRARRGQSDVFFFFPFFFLPLPFPSGQASGGETPDAGGDDAECAPRDGPQTAFFFFFFSPFSSFLNAR